MDFCRRALYAIKRLKSTVLDDGGAAGYDYHLSQDTENPADNSEERIQQPALKGLDVLNWCKGATPAGIIWSEAAREGKISLMRELLNHYPETVMDIIPTTRETPLHLVVRHGHCDVVEWIVEMLKRMTGYRDVVNRRDCDGNTVLHIATYKKQLQTLKLLLEDSSDHSGMFEINAKNNDGFSALDMLDVQPECEEVTVEIEGILRRAGASRVIVEQESNSSNREVQIELGKQWLQPLAQQVTCRSEFLTSKYQGLLLTATLFATMTFHAALRPPMVISENFPIEKQDSEINHLFVLFNSIAFFTSLALITILTHELPVKPWLLIAVSSTIGAYMCSVMVVSPQEVVTVSLVGSLILIAALMKCLSLDKIVLDCMPWMGT